jgi:hypothetical protein
LGISQSIGLAEKLRHSIIAGADYALGAGGVLWCHSQNAELLSLSLSHDGGLPGVREARLGVAIM